MGMLFGIIYYHCMMHADLEYFHYGIQLRQYLTLGSFMFLRAVIGADLLSTLLLATHITITAKIDLLEV